MLKYFFHTFGSGTVLEPQTLSLKELHDYLLSPMTLQNNRDESVLRIVLIKSNLDLFCTDL